MITLKKPHSGAMTLLPSIFLVLVFQITRFSMGDIVSEEWSKYFPAMGARGLLMNIDPTTGLSPTGNLTNLFPVGFLIGLVPSSNFQFFSPFLIDSTLSLMLTWASYVFLQHWKLSTTALVSSHLAIVSSFVFLNATQYQSKTYGAVLALVGFVLFRSQIASRRFHVLLVFLCIGTYGVISNPAVLITSFLFLALSTLSMRRSEHRFLPFQVRVRGLFILFALYIPGITHYWLNSSSYSQYRLNVQGVQSIFGSNHHAFSGGGYWAEDEIVNGRNFYFPWRTEFFHILESFEGALLIIIAITLIFLPYRTYNQHNECRLQRRIYVKRLSIILFAFYLIIAPLKWNILYLLMNLSGYFNVWREPWSKFELIAYCSFVAVLWARWDAINSTLEKDKESIDKVLRFKKRIKSVKRGLLSRTIARRNRRQLLALPIFPLFTIVISIAGMLSIISNLISTQGTILNNYSNWKSTYEQVQFVKEDEMVSRLLKSNPKIFTCIKAQTPSDYYYPTQSLLQRGISSDESVSLSATGKEGVQFGRCTFLQTGLILEYINSLGEVNKITFDKSSFIRTSEGYIILVSSGFF